MAFQYPWGNLQGLNLTWFVNQFKKLREDWATAEAGIEGSLDAEIQKAEDALSDVFDARDAAAASATAAAGSAAQAGTSATAAQNSATAAASSATLANNKATAAGVSEANATQSASQAALSASNAGNSATQASNSATAAGNSATSAGNSATAAAGSATAAAASETAAAASETAAAASASAAASAAASVKNKSLHDLILGVLFKNDFTYSETGYSHNFSGNYFEINFSKPTSTTYNTFALTNVPRSKNGSFGSADIIDDDLIDVSKIPCFENPNIDYIMLMHVENIGQDVFNMLLGTADENSDKHIDTTAVIRNTTYKNITSYIRDYKKFGLYFQSRKRVAQAETVKITVDIMPIPHDLATALALSN